MVDSISRYFEKEFMIILMGVMPSILARKGLAARDKVAKAFLEYFQNGGQEKGSPLPRQHLALYTRHEADIEDIARLEVGMSIAFLDNTAPALFWLLMFIYSRPQLLQEVRKELEAIVKTTTNANGEAVRNLDITTVTNSCPLLTSAFQETLRYRSMGTAVRQVMEDTILDGKWLLKKDALIQMPSRVIHVNSSIWGSDAADFDPYRFTKESIPTTSNGKRPPRTAFRAFGGGTTLCPGRHFATNEILALVSMFVMRFEMKPAKGGWKQPKTDSTRVATVIMEPDEDIEVDISPRVGLEGGKWVFGLKDSTSFLALAAEDQM